MLLLPAEERADAFIKEFELYHDCDDSQKEWTRNGLITLIKEQDRATRHTCAKDILVAASYGNGDIEDTLSTNSAYSACINAKAV